MELEQIVALVVAALPSLTAIIGCIITFLKNKTTCKCVIDKFEEMREEVFDSKQYNDLKKQLEVSYQENISLKRKINELVSAIDKIHREQDEE